MIRSSVIAVGLLFLASCSKTDNLAYAPTTPVVAGPATVSVVAVSDIRDEKPNRLVTVRDTYFIPIVVLDTDRPVRDEVEAVFNAAMLARGLIGTDAAPYRVQVTLRSLYANQYVDRRAYIDLDLAVSDRLGKVIYSDHVKDDREQLRLIYVDGIRGMAKMVNDLLDTTVDRMLDKPGFRAAIGQGAARS